MQFNRIFKEKVQFLTINAEMVPCSGCRTIGGRSYE
ncbi:MAG: hypothetical protein JWM44_3070 [Bacilli bacterium]|nr:hypothetical protein [Bacilli bacterium]